MHRRALIGITASATAALALHRTAAHQASTQVGTPEASPAWDNPDELFTMLLEAPFASSLLPGDPAEVVITEWVDDSDSDLDGVVGGLLIGGPGEDEAGMYGVIIVHPDPESALRRIGEVVAEVDAGTVVHEFGFGGSTGVTEVHPSSGIGDDTGYAVSVITMGPLIISGGAEAEDADDEPAPRSAVHAIAIADHVRRTLGTR